MFPVVVLGALGLAWWLTGLAPRRLQLSIWAALIVVAVVPWLGYQGHSHWDLVQWVPFAAPPAFSMADVLINLALYAPLGAFAARRERPWSLGAIGVSAGALSIATEFTQVFSHGRFPTAGDVVLNVAGALAGAALARRASRGRAG